MAEWPPKKGELWMATDRWPATHLEPAVNGGEMVMIMTSEEMVDQFSLRWWQGDVLGPAGRRFIKAAKGDLIPADDPRICASSTWPWYN